MASVEPETPKAIWIETPKASRVEKLALPFPPFPLLFPSTSLSVPLPLLSLFLSLLFPLPPLRSRPP